MTDVRIYKPTKTATQSGRRNTRAWVLEYEPGARKETDPLMGWVGSADTKGQVRLKFQSKEEAVAFARKNGITYHLQEPKPRRIRPKNYADNFGFHRPF
ncbi:MAG: ETC complex I subunit [Rhodospirillales bacterium]|nr:ETC complex I subunit [Rhodospirillales bacterium]